MNEMRKWRAENWIEDGVPGVVRITCNYICATMYIMKLKIDAWSCLFIRTEVWSKCVVASGELVLMTPKQGRYSSRFGICAGMLRAETKS
jgi:hypothetical protein